MTGPKVDQARRAGRWDALRTLWRESSLPRVRNCRRVAADSEAGVAVRVNEHGAGLAGVQTCGSVWACPACSAKVAAVRADEIAQVLDGHRRNGGSAVLWTGTLSHSRAHRLAASWDAISYGWNATGSGRGWAEDKDTYGIVGFVRVAETRIAGNGWHVHTHVVILTDRLLDYDERQALGDRMHDRWAGALGRKGYSCDREHGSDVRAITGTGALGDYFTKATYELTGAAHKVGKTGSLSPFDLLRLVVEDGDADALDDWHEWERASKGRRQLSWSRGLRARYIEAPELEDEEIAAQVEDGETVAWFPGGTYTRLAVAGLVPELLALAETDLPRLWSVLRAAGVYFEIPDQGRIRPPSG